MSSLHRCFTWGNKNCTRFQSRSLQRCIDCIIETPLVMQWTQRWRSKQTQCQKSNFAHKPAAQWIFTFWNVPFKLNSSLEQHVLLNYQLTVTEIKFLVHLDAQFKFQQIVLTTSGLLQCDWLTIFTLTQCDTLRPGDQLPILPYWKRERNRRKLRETLMMADLSRWVDTRRGSGKVWASS